MNPMAAPLPRRERINQARLLLLMLASLGALVASLFILDWFRASAREISGDVQAIDLRSVSICAWSPASGCRASLEHMSQNFPGFHPYIEFARTTLWMSSVFGAIVAVQVGSKLLTDTARRILSFLGVLAGVLTMSLAGMTAYAFHPRLKGFNVEARSAPIVLGLGCAFGIVALYYAARIYPTESAARRVPFALASIERSRPTIASIIGRLRTLRDVL